MLNTSQQTFADGSDGEIIISSVHNPRLRNLVLLSQKSSERRSSGMFVVEGQREVGQCIGAGYDIAEIYYNYEAIGSEQLANLRRYAHEHSTQLVALSAAAYSRVAYRDSTENVVAVARSKSHALEQLHLPASPLIMVLERVEKPGNIGAALRSADSAGASALIICDPLTDIYNPNLIRASLGAVFTVPTAVCTTADCIDYLRQRNIQILTAQLQDSQPYYSTDMCGPTAIVMGAESTGLSQQWRDAADRHIRIPMLGRMDSLNVSVSAAVLLYEAVRQRSLKGQ